VSSDFLQSVWHFVKALLSFNDQPAVELFHIHRDFCWFYIERRGKGHADDETKLTGFAQNSMV
jgi:hypothetical protein